MHLFVQVVSLTLAEILRFSVAEFDERSIWE